MSRPKLVIILAVVVLLFAVALGFSQRRDASSIGDPSHSSLAVVLDIVPQRSLEAGDLVGVACLDKTTFVVSVAPCQFDVPGPVKRVLLHWVRPPGSAMTITLARKGSLTQTYRSGDAPQDSKHPDDLTVPILGKGTVVVLQCTTPVPCEVALRQ